MNLTARTGERKHDVRIERRDGVFVVVVDGVEHLVDAHKLDADFYSILMNGRSYEVSVEAAGDTYHVRHGAAEQIVRLSDPSREGRDELFATRTGPETIASVMPGKIVRILVSEGESVDPGQGLIVVEAMKMENEIASPRPGKVVKIEVAEGQAVESGAALLTLE